MTGFEQLHAMLERRSARRSARPDRSRRRPRRVRGRAGRGADHAYTTLELKIAYHRAMTHQTGPVRAEGIVTVSGKRVAYAEAKLTDAQCA